MRYLWLLLLPSVCLASGPKYSYPDQPQLDDEIRQIYHDIRAVGGGNYSTSSMTLNGLTASSATIGNLTSTNGTITNLTSTNGTITNLTVTALSGVSLGKVRQIQCGKTATDFSTTNSAFQTTNLTVNISPTVATSTIVVVACGALTNNTSGQETDAAIFRGNTNLCDATFGCGASRVDATGMGLVNVLSCFVTGDAPATTSATGYQIKIKATGGTGHFGNSATQNMCLFEVGV